MKVTRENTDWREWIKTVGKVEFPYDDTVEIIFDDNKYVGKYRRNRMAFEIVFNIDTNTKTDINFMSAFKIAMRKTAYCVGCQVCEANCPHGFIRFENGNVLIDDRCVKCRKCHDIFHGCLLANSMRLPKVQLINVNRKMKNYYIYFPL